MRTIFYMFLLIILLITISYGQFYQTRSMDSTTFTLIKTGLNTDDFLSELNQELSLTENEEELEENGEGVRLPTWDFFTYRKAVFQLVFNDDSTNWSGINGIKKR